VDDRHAVSHNAKIREGNQFDATCTLSQAPSFTALKSTRDGSHMIAFTGDDKSIHVFNHDGKGELKHLSQR
jgi:tRNA (guanine-N(7)-)-methyltransferase subunit TRM82